VPYAPNIVPAGDYYRVLAEFWADGPQSETPPGHWFTIANRVSDHPLARRQLEGKGRELGPLEWDVKLYLALGGAMHAVAVAAWGVKGWYDYVRPVSAIRYMCDMGQSRSWPAVRDPDGIPGTGSHRIITADSAAQEHGTRTSPGKRANIGKIAPRLDPDYIEDLRPTRPAWVGYVAKTGGPTSGRPS
jgi:hypothetical protein